MVGGYLNKNAGNSIYIAVPDLKASGIEFITSSVKTHLFRGGMRANRNLKNTNVFI